MGVPKFFRFISERYPLINTRLASDPPQIDNLYLDMNGIIHNCARSSPGNSNVDTKRYTSLPSIRQNHDIFLDVFKYIDNLVAILPPRRLLYMAVDGVAPRAKMNQQRSRRFRSAKERLDEHLRRQREDPLYAAADIDPFDSNCITPGTSFMAQLTTALRYFVARKISDDPSWAHLNVVLSGPEAPGEGEHKIMAYIRAIRESGQLSPNTRHAVYGLDADLIMLALVTHEPHFFLLREKIDFSMWRRNKSGPRLATPLDLTRFGEFELLSIGLLREYIALEVGGDGNSSLSYFDIDRITDDFVFILMLIGNDFLPNLPTLDIADGTLTVMLHLYRRLLPLMGGYLTNAGKINPRRFEFMLAKLALLEENILRHRREESPNEGRGRRGRGNRARAFVPSELDALFGVTRSDPNSIPSSFSDSQLASETETIRAMLANTPVAALKEEYYAEKFGRDFQQDPDALRELVASYVTGVSWTLKYYTEGCRLWRWFYPYHYAPLASDIMDIAAVLQRSEDDDETQNPFYPFEQLLSVLPPASAWCLPKPYRSLMTNPNSPLADKFPLDFELDMNGKRNDWEAVVLLPFVDEQLLLNAIKSIPVSELAREEVERNQLGQSIVFSYSASYAEHVVSPFGGRLPSFVSHAQPKDLQLPTLEEGQPFSITPLIGTRPAGSSEDLADLPSLGQFVLHAQLQSIGVNVFGMPSRSESLVLFMDSDTIREEDAPTNGRVFGEADISLLDQKGVTVGSTVWFGFPWRKPGVVESISNKLVTKRLVPLTGFDPNQPVASRVNISTTLKSDFEQDASAIVSILFQKSAISVKKPEQVVRILSDEMNPSDKENDDPVDRQHERFIKQRPAPLSGVLGRSRPLSPGQIVMYVGHGGYFGQKCTVVAQLGHGLVRVQFHKPIAAAREAPFGYRVISSMHTQRWFPLSRLAAEVGLSPSLVDAFLGSVRVRLSSDKEEIDLGLGVKYIGRGLFVVGYARRDERNHYTFSEKALDVLRRYYSAFPGLFEAVETLRREELKPGNSGGRSKGALVYSSSDLFSVKHPDDAVKAAAAWLSVQDVATQPLVSATSEVLPADKVSELERHCRIILALQVDYEASLGGCDPAKTVRDMTRASLVTGHEGVDWGIPAECENGVALHFEPVPVDGTGLRLGDRVTNRLARGGVPFALRGTVVGIHPGETDGDGTAAATTVEVVFDEAFISGGDLSGKCSDGRGKAVPANSLFIVRPERDNAYYTKHYARVAAMVGQMMKGEEEEAQKDKRSKAIASAATASYADVLKGGDGGKKNVPQRSAAIGSGTTIAPTVPSVDSTAPRSMRTNDTREPELVAVPMAGAAGEGSESAHNTVKQGANTGSSVTQATDWPKETWATTISQSGTHAEEGGKREAGGGNIDARVASVAPPSWVGSGGRGGRGRRGRGVSGGGVGNGSGGGNGGGGRRDGKGSGQGRARWNGRDREAEVQRLSEELKRAIGVGSSNTSETTSVGGGNVGSGTGRGGGWRGRGRRGGRGRGKNMGRASGQETDEYELASKWDELQEQEQAKMSK